MTSPRGTIHCSVRASECVPWYVLFEESTSSMTSCPPVYDERSICNAFYGKAISSTIGKTFQCNMEVMCLGVYYEMLIVKKYNVCSSIILLKMYYHCKWRNDRVNNLSYSSIASTVAAVVACHSQQKMKHSQTTQRYKEMNSFRI